MTKFDQYWIDKEAIRELSLVYSMAMDTGDRKLLRSCFTPDGVWQTANGTFYGGDGIENAPPIFAGLDMTQHVDSNHIATIDGDNGKARSYYVATYKKEGAPGGALLTVGGIYRDRYIKCEGRWLIKHRIAGILWSTGNSELIVLPQAGPYG